MAGIELVEQRGEEGDKAETPWGKVVRRFLWFYKNQNLTLRAGESLRLGVVTGATGRTQVLTGSLRLQCREWPLGGEGHRERPGE